MADTALDGIRRRIRLELERGRAIAFVGWRDSYHDDFTRSIPPEKVVFTDSSAPPAHVGFIFFTRNVTPTLRGRISNNRSVSHVPLDPQDVRSLLKECAGMIVPSPVRVARAPQASTSDEILDVLTKPQELSAMEKFVQAFRAEAAKNDGRVGRRMVGKMIREHGTESVIKLVAGGWIVAEVAKGKKRVGWYRAGEKMAELERKATILPDDPLERARFMLAQKDSLTAEKERLEGLLTAVKEKLELIEKIDQTIGQLNNLMK